MTRSPAIAFDESGAVPSVDFDYPQDEPLRERQGLLVQLLASIPVDNPRMTGIRFLFFMFLLGPAECHTQAELARRLKVTPGRVSQILNTLRAEFTEALLPEVIKLYPQCWK